MFITDRGVPAHVLPSIEEYQRLDGKQVSLIDQLGLPQGIEEIELELPMSREPAQGVDFT